MGLVQRIVRFVMRTEPKALYRTVQYEYAYRYTPNIYIFIYLSGVERFSVKNLTVRFSTHGLARTRTAIP